MTLKSITYLLTTLPLSFLGYLVFNNNLNYVEKIKGKKSFDCFLQSREVSLPKIRTVLGDTIKTGNTYAWLKRLASTQDDELILDFVKREDQYVDLNRTEKFFVVNETENYISVGCLSDEGEYSAIFLYCVSKSDCGILGKVMLAESSAWEHGYKRTFSVIENDFSIKRMNRNGSKDWGDYTKWKKDTTTTSITFDEKGMIVIDEK